MLILDGMPPAWRVWVEGAWRMVKADGPSCLAASPDGRTRLKVWSQPGWWGERSVVWLRVWEDGHRPFTVCLEGGHTPLQNRTWMGRPTVPLLREDRGTPAESEDRTPVMYFGPPVDYALGPVSAATAANA